MELKRLIITTQLLLNDIIDVNKAAFMEVRADNEEVTGLWKDYNRLRSILIQSFPLLFNTLPEHSVPEPSIAKDDSFHFVGTLVFKPEHFSGLRMEVEKILDTLRSLNKREKDVSQNYTQKQFRA